MHFEADQYRIFGGSAMQAGFYPSAQRLVIIVFGVQSNSTTVWFFAGRFLEKQAFMGISEGDSPTSGVFDQRVKVHVRVESEQGQRESVLASRFAMAGAGIATSSSEDWLNVQFELGD
jgi:hypothetical protein